MLSGVLQNSRYFFYKKVLQILADSKNSRTFAPVIEKHLNTKQRMARSSIG